MTQRWEIDKSFSFCYGHRVWVQEINTNFTEVGHTCPKCRHIHGHEGLVHVHLAGTELNKQGMVEDFVNLGWCKNFLDNHLDHKFILDLNDPWAPSILSAFPKFEAGLFVGLTTLRPLNTTEGNNISAVPVFVPGTSFQVGWELDVSKLSGPEKEFYEGYFIVDFVPTSENLAKWLFDAVDAKMSLINVRVSKISWNETPKSRAVYTRDE